MHSNKHFIQMTTRVTHFYPYDIVRQWINIADFHLLPCP